MKLYTSPRPLYIGQLRPGDQIATVKKSGDLIRSETALFDAELAGAVQWSVVHYTTTGDKGGMVHHTLGEHNAYGRVPLMVREVIQIDPWSYVHGQNAEGLPE